MRKRNIGWRIDYILASRTIAERATECKVLADVGTSDHAPIMMTVADLKLQPSLPTCFSSSVHASLPILPRHSW